MTLLAAGTSLLDPVVANLPATILVIVFAVLLAAAVAAAVATIMSRRRKKGSDEIVLYLEEMRSGKVARRLEVDPRSPLAPIAESASRLGQELALRFTKAESASEGFYALQEAARGYAVIATDADGDLRALSPGAAQMFGWEEDAVVGRNASLLFDASAWKDLLPKLARKSLRERGIETRALMAREDGGRFHARLVIRMLGGHGGEPPGFLMVVQDVTEQVRVETELRASESRSRGMLEGWPGGAALVEQGKLLYANRAMREMLDLAEAEVAGFPLRRRIATSHVLVVQDALSRLEQPGRTEPVEVSIVLSGSPGAAGREVRFTGVPYAHEGKTSVLVSLRDETTERRLFRTLAADEARLDAVLDAWSDAVLLLEDDVSGSRVRLVNRAFVELFDLAPGGLSGISESELSARLRGAGPLGAAAVASLAALTSGPATETVETVDGTFAVRALPIEGRQGAARLRMLLARDVSSEKAVETAAAGEVARWRQRHESALESYETLRAMHDELETRRRDAESLAAELRTLDGMKSDLLANVSHELQTPLVSIRGYTEMILKGRLGPINEEQKKGLALSLKNIDRLISMIDNLLAFARTDRESTALRLTSFPLSSLIDEAQALLAPRIDEKRIRVTRTLDDPAVSIRADRDKILQVFLNLIGNAVKFNRADGTIDIEVRAGKPGFALVQIKDSGVGIAKEDLEKVFDRFYRADDQAAAQAEGSGIGLAIVRNILRLHGCVIQARSEEGAGAVFAFTLPLAGERDQAEDAAPRSAPPAPVPPGDAPAAPETSAPPSKPAPPTARGRLRIIRRA